MKSLLKQLVTIASLSILIACATPQEQGGSSSGADRARHGDCIHEPSIRGYEVLDEQNLIVEASGRRNYHVVLMHRAFGLRSSWGIVFRTSAGRVCEGFSEVVFRDGFDGESIRIRSIRQLTSEEREDLLIRFGKKEPEIEQTPVPRDVEGADVVELDPDAGA